MPSFSNCPICGKEFKVVRNINEHFCSRKCYALSKKGKAWGGAISSAGKKLGAYNKDRVHKMVQGKKDSHLARAMLNPEFVSCLNEARQLLKEGYVHNLSQLFRAVNIASLLPKEHKYGADLYYVLLEKEKLSFYEKEIPCSIAGFNLEQLNWFKWLLTTASDWRGFIEKFLKDHEALQISRRTCSYGVILQFVQATNFPTKVLRKDLSKNKHGFSTERAFRKLLDSQKLNYKDQVKLVDANNTCYYFADFVINGKLIVEINGDYWHGWGKEIQELRGAVKRRCLADLKKYEFYENSNYAYLVIWEHELQNPSSIIEKVQESLKSAEYNKRIV